MTNTAFCDKHGQSSARCLRPCTRKPLLDLVRKELIGFAASHRRFRFIFSMLGSSNSASKSRYILKVCSLTHARSGPKSVSTYLCWNTVNLCGKNVNLLVLMNRHIGHTNTVHNSFSSVVLWMCCTLFNKNWIDVRFLFRLCRQLWGDKVRTELWATGWLAGASWPRGHFSVSRPPTETAVRPQQGKISIACR